MSGKYDDYLGSALTSRVDKMRQQASDLLSLREELAIVSTLAGDAMVGYDNAVRICNEKKDMRPEDREKVLNIARSRVYDAVDRVKEMTLAAKRVEENGDQMDVSIVHALITKTVEIVSEEIEVVDAPMAAIGFSGQTLLDRVASRIRSAVLDVREIPKTALTHEKLDDELRAMHSSVPYVEGAAG